MWLFLVTRSLQQFSQLKLLIVRLRALTSVAEAGGKTALNFVFHMEKSLDA